MNKKLEETFNLPSMEDAMENQKEADKVADDLDHSSTAAHKEMEAESSKELDPDVVSKALSTAEKIDKALPQVKDLESHDSDMDTYSTEAIKSYKELMDLGMASEARHAGKFFEVAQTMMKNAIEAKNAKADKKLRMIELQLKNCLLYTSPSPRDQA